MKALTLQKELEEAHRARVYMLEHGSVLQYIDAVERHYRAVGRPLGASMAGLGLWLRFGVAITSN